MSESEQPLMRLDGFDVEFDSQAEQVRADALDFSSMIQVVRDTSTNNMASQAQTAILGILRSIEKTRKELKAPIKKLGEKIDQIAKDYVEPLKEENTRLSRLMGDWHALETAKRNAEMAARIKDLQETERAKIEEIAKAKSLDEVDEIRERYDERAAALSVMAPPPEKPRNQVVRELWDVTIVDIWLLARMHPTCVEIKPRMQQIQELLNGGHQVAGIKAEKRMSVTARTA